MKRDARFEENIASEGEVNRRGVGLGEGGGVHERQSNGQTRTSQKVGE